MARRDIEDMKSPAARETRRAEEDGGWCLCPRRLPDPRLRRRILARLDALLAARRA